MSVLGNYIKQPAEIETYTIVYEDDLVETDTINAAVATVSPAGLTVDYCTFVNEAGNRRTRTKVSGGTNGTKYKVTVRVTTDDGRVLEDEFFVKIKDY
jgi:high-affinity K+ transport system ATPase subunit B